METRLYDKPRLLDVAHRMPALIDVRYKCPRDGMQARMNYFYGGPAYAHHMHYAIKCPDPMCPNSEVRMEDWKDSPEEAIAAWNRRLGE